MNPTSATGMGHAAPESDLIVAPFTPFLNAREKHYRDHIQPLEDPYGDIQKWYSRIEDGRRQIIPFLKQAFNPRGDILELGAGTCWLSSELSKLDGVRKLCCVEMSDAILRNVAPRVMEHLGADRSKITRMLGDFNKLDLQEESFDFVFFDSALHHIPGDAFDRVLTEVHRVMKADGRGIAVREPFLSPIPFFRVWQRRHFGRHEKRFGVTENIFSNREWKQRIERCGFRFSTRSFWRIKQYDSPLKRALYKILQCRLPRQLRAWLLPGWIGQEKIIVFVKS
jgi:SAM-dependent methyltransferase